MLNANKKLTDTFFIFACQTVGQSCMCITVKCDIETSVTVFSRNTKESFSFNAQRPFIEIQNNCFNFAFQKETLGN